MTRTTPRQSNTPWLAWLVALWMPLTGILAFTVHPVAVGSAFRGSPRCQIARAAKKSKQAANNRANQMNPNNPQYYKSKGKPLLHGEPRQKHAEKQKRSKQNRGNFEKRAHELGHLANKDKLDTDAFDRTVKAMRRVAPHGKLLKTGSRAKGTSIPGSDFDYHWSMPKSMSTAQRDQVLKQSEGVTCKKAFTIEPPSGPSIDIFPPNAEWHEGAVPVQRPGSVKFQPGAQKAVRKLKMKFPGVPGFKIEEQVLKIQREKGWTDRNDATGLNRFQEAQRRIVEETGGTSL